MMDPSVSQDSLLDLRVCCTYQGCDVTFRNMSELQRHIRIHTGDRPFKCDKCSKAFARKACLTRHKAVHAKDTPFNCKVCNKGFTFKFALTRHERLHSHTPAHPAHVHSSSAAFKPSRKGACKAPRRRASSSSSSAAAVAPSSAAAAAAQSSWCSTLTTDLQRCNETSRTRSPSPASQPPPPGPKESLFTSSLTSPSLSCPTASPPLEVAASRPPSPPGMLNTDVLFRDVWLGPCQQSNTDIELEVTFSQNEDIPELGLCHKDLRVLQGSL